MATIKNLDWLRKRTAAMVSFDVDAADEAFSGPADYPWMMVDQAINERYKSIILDAAQGVDPDFFKFTRNVNWPASQVTLDLPAGCSRVSLLEIRLTTAGLPGTSIVPTAGYNSSSEIYWSGANTLSWGSTGPGGAEILTLTYRAVPVDMTEPMEEPSLLPYEFRDMIYLGASIDLVGDQNSDDVPQSWLDRFTKWEWRWHNAINQAAPASGSYTENIPTEILP